MNSALRTAVGALVALLVLQFAWHAWLAPPKSGLLAPTLLLATAPLFFCLWIAATSLRRGVLIGGMACLFYFSHGIVELWIGAPPRWPAAVEIALALIVVFAPGWEVRSAKRASHQS
ncbi:MAG: DUF2069 domain-containing protein [Rudaea sp.]|uniref:DUF2069 domain-containing protein n=1 Tax=Rudaea sp. TaxID=2136325 RepID=UPI0039E286C9